MARRFLTVPEELEYYADLAADYLEQHGYDVAVEHRELGYPYAPTLRCERAPTTLLVEVDSGIRRDRTSDWIGYTRSSSTDIRIALAMPTDSARAADDETWLRAEGVGLYLCGDDLVQEAIPPLDMSLNLQPPNLASLDREIRRVLGPIYEQFGRSQWREGFKDACQAVEFEAREYLKRHVALGRLTFVTSAGRQRLLSSEQIDRMTMGQLAGAFGDIETQTYSDSMAGEALRLLNTDRVNITHHSTRPETEEALRKNVGQHMWRVVAALKELTPTP